MMSRREEAHWACLNILSDNKDSAPRIAELCTLSRLLGSEVDAITAERDELKRKHDEVNENYMGLVNLILPHLRAAQECAIAEGRDNG